MTNNKQPAVIVAIPTTRNYIHSTTAVSIMGMIIEAMHEGIGVGILVTTDIPADVARNQLIGHFLDNPLATHLFFADSDMIYPANTLTKLISDNKPLVSGLCYQRGPPFAPVIIKRELTKKGLRSKWLPFTNKMENKLIQCDATGAACLLLKKEVFENNNENGLKPPYFKFIYNDDRNKIELGEDIYFFDQCKYIGLQCIIDTNIICGHVADTTITVPQTFNEGWLSLGIKSVESLKKDYYL